MSTHSRISARLKWDRLSLCVQTCNTHTVRFWVNRSSSSGSLCWFHVVDSFFFGLPVLLWLMSCLKVTSLMLCIVAFCRWVRNTYESGWVTTEWCMKALNSTDAVLVIASPKVFRYWTLYTLLDTSVLNFSTLSSPLPVNSIPDIFFTWLFYPFCSTYLSILHLHKKLLEKVCDRANFSWPLKGIRS